MRLAPYGLIARHGVPDDIKRFFILHEGIIQMADGTLTEITYNDATELDVVERGGRARPRSRRSPPTAGSASPTTTG